MYAPVTVSFICFLLKQALGSVLLNPVFLSINLRTTTLRSVNLFNHRASEHTSQPLALSTHSFLIRRSLLENNTQATFAINFSTLRNSSLYISHFSVLTNRTSISFAISHQCTTFNRSAYSTSKQKYSSSPQPGSMLHQEKKTKTAAAEVEGVSSNQLTQQPNPITKVSKPFTHRHFCLFRKY